MSIFSHICRTAALLLCIPLALAQESAPPEEPPDLPELPDSVRRLTVDQTDPEFWKMAVEHTQPLTPDVYRHTGRRLLAEGTFRATYRALTLLRRAARLHPEDAELQALLVEALVAPYRWTWDRDPAWVERAEQQLAQAQVLAPDAPAVHRARGLLLMLDNRLADAEDSLRRALAAVPEEVETLLILGAVLRLQDRYEAAYEILGRARLMAPADWRAYSSLADVYRDDEWFEEALNLYRKAHLLQREAFAPAFGQALVFHRIGNNRQAVRMYRELMEEHPDNADLILLAAAAAHMRERQYGAALDELNQMELGGERGLCRGSVLYRIGLCHLRLGHTEEAVAAFLEVTESYPEARDGSDYGPLVLFPAVTELSALYEKQGLPEEAAEVLRRASLHPSAPLEVQLALADKLLTYRLHDMATEVLRRALSRETDDDPLAERVRARVQLVRSRVHGPDGLESADQRLGEVDAEAERDGTSADCYQLARGYALADEEEQALAWLSRAVERGYRAFDRIRRDPDLAPLHNLPAFRELVRGR
jgi:tetratricopeptide (TPR) repeat protein